jgi:hypothetical protein
MNILVNATLEKSQVDNLVLAMKLLFPVGSHLDGSYDIPITMIVACLGLLLRPTNPADASGMDLCFGINSSD